MAIKKNQIQQTPTVIQEGAQPATGPNKGAFYSSDVSGVTEGMYADDLGRAIQLTNGGEISMPSTFNGENVVTAGSQIFKERSGNKLRFRRIVAGTNVTVTEGADSITIASTGGGGGSGEANTGANVGAGSQVFKQKSGVALQFRSFVAGSNITLTQGADTITIASTGGGSGEANTASNVGSGAGILFKQKTGVDLEFKRIAAGTGISVTNGVSDITISSTGEANTASNVGTTGANTAGVFKAKSGVDLQMRRIVAGANVSVTESTNDITIAATAGSGETNTASNSSSGTGTGLLFKGKVGVDLVFKRLLAGSGVTLTNGADDVTIAATGGGGGHETQILSFDSGNIVVKASGTTSDLALVTATKDFNAAGASTLIMNKPTSVCYHSINVTFTSAETTGRTELRLECPDANGATAESKAMRVFAIRINSTYGVAATASTFVLVSGTTFRTTLTGYTSAQEQKAVFQF